MSGERQDDRAAMDRVAKRLIDSGIKPADAVKEARESMTRTDRNLTRQGKR